MEMSGGERRPEWWEPFGRKILDANFKAAVEMNCIVSPHEMWVTLKSDLKKRDEILDYLNGSEFQESSQSVEEAVRQFPPYKPGMGCIAKVPEWGVWARAETARLAEPTEDGVTWGVRLVDYGDLLPVPARFLRLVPRTGKAWQLCKTPALAIKTSLDNVGWKDGDGRWSEAVVSQLKRYLSHVKDMETRSPPLREEGEDPAWFKHLVDFTIAGGGKSATCGKTLTNAFIYEGHAIYTTHPDRRIVAGGVLKQLAQWDFPPLPGLSLPHDDHKRIRVTIGNFDARQGKIAVCVDDPSTARRKVEIAEIMGHFYFQGKAPPLRPEEAGPGTLAVLRYERESSDGSVLVGFYRAQIRRLIRRPQSPPAFHLYLIDEAVEISNAHLKDLFQMASELQCQAPLAIPAVLHAFHNPPPPPPPIQPQHHLYHQEPLKSKVEYQMNAILKHYVAKPGVVSMKVMTLKEQDIEVVIYLGGFVHSLNDILLGFSGNERDRRWLEFLDHGGKMLEALEGSADPHPYVDSFFKAENYRKAMEAEGRMGMVLPPILESPTMGRGTQPLYAQPPMPGPAYGSTKRPQRAYAQTHSHSHPQQAPNFAAPLNVNYTVAGATHGSRVSFHH